MNFTRESALAAVDAVFRAALAAVFVYAAWTKLLDPGVFASAVASYKMLPAPLVAVVAIVLPPAELLAGLALVLTRWQRESALIVLSMLAVFLVGLVQAQVRGLDIGCGCFGGEEGDTVPEAIVRDIVLIVPAVWLAVRRNRPAWGWKWRIAAVAALAALLAYATVKAGPAAKIAEVQEPAAEGASDSNGREEDDSFVPKSAEEALAEVFAQFPAPDTNSVAPEAWSRDFPAALARSRAENRPLVMVVGATSCPYCKRLRTNLSGAGFEKWADGSGMYFVEQTFLSVTNPPMAEAMYKFMENAPGRPKMKAFPQVCVFWEKPSGERVWTSFMGRHGMMPGEFRNSLLCEFANSMEAVLGDYLAGVPKRPGESELLAATAKHVKIKIEGEGTVNMVPAHGLLLDNGQNITAIARPAKGWRFAGWRTPSGKVHRDRFSETRLIVSYSMQGGTYVAVFRRKAKSSGTPKRAGGLAPIGKGRPAAGD